MSPAARPPGKRWRDAQGIPIPVGAVVEQTGVDHQLGALRSQLGKHRLVVRFPGETALARIQPQLLRIVGPGERHQR